VTVPTVTYKSSGGGITQGQPEIDTVTMEATPLYTPRRYKDTFVAVVGEDAIVKDTKGVEKIYGYPLSMDTLQLFYNRDLLDKAGIAEPPTTWEEFNKSIEKLRKIDPGTNKIVQAAAALGRADNIDRATDIVMLLMAQNGAKLKDESGRPSFDLIPVDLKNRTKAPGPEALAFYTDFANPGKSDVYTWSKDLPSSVDMFSRGTLAYFFGYSYHRDQLLERAPKLNYGVAPVPQLNSTPVHMANYWIEAVTKKSKHQDEAWHFLNFITQEQQAATYLKKTTRPTALRSLVKKQLDDNSLEVIKPFIQGVLVAKNWYQGNDEKTAEQIISSMIKRVNDNAFEPGVGDIYVAAVRDAVHQLDTTR
jgi:ABC-type glycerol-3-phosphate transport system substrate-binding protein